MSEELNPSELGTLDYWENTYSEEMDNFQNHGDVGKIWFGGTTASKIVGYISDEINLSKEEDKIIDLGCGNGMLLVQLANKGFKKITGVDYSEKAIHFSKQVLEDRGINHVELSVCDITTFDDKTNLTDFKVVNDKGTYDAISLNPENSKEKRENYMENVKNFLCNDGYFILTSCNWTREELTEHFEKYFNVVHEIPVKSFTFGGKTGNRVTQLVFRKKL